MKRTERFLSGRSPKTANVPWSSPFVSFQPTADNYSVCRKLIRSFICCEVSPIWKRWL